MTNYANYAIYGRMFVLNVITNRVKSTQTRFRVDQFLIASGDWMLFMIDFYSIIRVISHSSLPYLMDY
jgi:hypothetical protein